MITASLLDDSL